MVSKKTCFATIIVLAAMLLVLASVPAQPDQAAAYDTNQTYQAPVTIDPTAANDTETSSPPHNDSSPDVDLINSTDNDRDGLTGTEIKQSIRDFVAASEEPVTADDIVSFVNGNALGAGADEISFGSEYVFNSADTACTSVSALDATHFVVAYRDYGNSSYGTAVIGTVSGSTISYGSEYVFNSAATDQISVSALNATHFVVAYRDYGNSEYGTAVIGTVSGSTISYGSEHVFNFASTSYTSVSALDATHFVVAYRDHGNSYYGTAVIGTVSDSTISYGSEYVFNSADTYYTPVSALDATHFVVAYRDHGNSSYGIAVIGTVSGSTISYGSEHVFNFAYTDCISVSALDATHFVVAYRDSGNSEYGTAVIGTVSGSTISYDPESVFNSAYTYYTSVSALDATHFVVAYMDNGNSNYGTAVIGTVSGSTISYGSEYVFNSAATYYTSVSALDATHFVVAYRDWGISGYGTAVIGTVSAQEPTYNCTCGDICVNTSGWWRDGGAFNANATTPIQAAVDNATAGETIYVYNGSYTENVNVNERVTLQGEGADVVNVTAANSDDHVFEVQQDYVNISEFNVIGATGLPKAGIYIGSGVDHCNISDNNASDNNRGIYLTSSNNNSLTNNTANANTYYGIYLSSLSKNNTLMNNTANLNTISGIYLSSLSNHNSLTNNTASDNTQYGIHLDSSNNNSLTNNTMSGNTHNFGVNADSLSDYTHDIDTSNTVDGKPIYYWVDRQDEQIPSGAGFVGVVNSTNITVSDIVLTKTDYGVLVAYTNDSRVENVTASNNYCGIYLFYSSNNSLTNNTVKLNYNGIYLWNASGNNITCNWVHGNTRAGFNLTGGSTGNNISCNNIVANGVPNGTAWEWQFYNNQTQEVEAKNNYWGAGMTNATINASIKENTGNVTFYPFAEESVPCAPIPELSTVILLGVGLLLLAGYLRIRRKR